MFVIKKILSIVVMILAGLGIVICVAGVIGAWAVNEPAKQTATGALTAVEQYSTLGRETAMLVNGNISDIRTAVGEMSQTLARAGGEDRTLNERLNNTILPKLKSASAAVQVIGKTAVSINQTLISVNRIPGMSVPTFTDELQIAGQRLQDVNAGVESLRAGLAGAGANVDGAGLRAAASDVATALDAAQSALDATQARLQNVSSAAAATAARVPGWIDAVSLITTLLLVLFAAGQVFLFKAGLDWFRKLKVAPC